MNWLFQLTGIISIKLTTMFLLFLFRCLLASASLGWWFLVFLDKLEYITKILFNFRSKVLRQNTSRKLFLLRKNSIHCNVFLTSDKCRRVKKEIFEIFFQQGFCIYWNESLYIWRVMGNVWLGIFQIKNMQKWQFYKRKAINLFAKIATWTLRSFFLNFILCQFDQLCRKQTYILTKSF